jgi:hypothetical protein
LVRLGGGGVRLGFAVSFLLPLRIWNRWNSGACWPWSKGSGMDWGVGEEGDSFLFFGDRVWLRGLAARSMAAGRSCHRYGCHFTRPRFWFLVWMFISHSVDGPPSPPPPPLPWLPRL